MNPLIELYRYAEENKIDIDWFNSMNAPSLSAMLPDGECCIAVNPWMMDSLSEEIVAIAHELGHCETGSFYSIHSPHDIRRKHENRADKWAIEKLIPKSKLCAVIKNGRTDVWELAEWFQVTEDFMRKAIQWYRDGNVNG